MEGAVCKEKPGRKGGRQEDSDRESHARVEGYCRSLSADSPH